MTCIVCNKKATVATGGKGYCSEHAREQIKKREEENRLKRAQELGLIKEG